MGAWIETRLIYLTFDRSESHPTWVRGLKQAACLVHDSDSESHPTWVRGLKLQSFADSSFLCGRILHGCVDWNNDENGNPKMCYRSHPTWVRGLKLLLPSRSPLIMTVASYMGAWIETKFNMSQVNQYTSRILHGCVDWNGLLQCGAANGICVASYMGAWIETYLCLPCLPSNFVASYMGAWIETQLVVRAISKVASHPTWVRGLKRDLVYFACCIDASHPTWVRGLKLNLWTLLKNVLQSHPTWVRGLKPHVASHALPLWVASYMGAWIETDFSFYRWQVSGVASYMGAWIETSK